MQSHREGSPGKWMPQLGVTPVKPGHRPCVQMACNGPHLGRLKGDGLMGEGRGSQFPFSLKVFVALFDLQTFI